MSDFLPKAVREGLEEARAGALRRASRLRVHDGEAVHRVLRMWDGGFALARDDAPMLHGHVDLYDGATHLYRCLVVTSREDKAERVYEFKWSRLAADRPPVDFEEVAAPSAGLIPGPG